MLNVTPGTIIALARRNIITADRIGKRDLYNLESVKKFREKFSPAHMYATELGCDRAQSAYHLRRQGIAVAFSKAEVGTTIFRRTDVEMALGRPAGALSAVVDMTEFFAPFE